MSSPLRTKAKKHVGSVRFWPSTLKSLGSWDSRKSSRSFPGCLGQSICESHYIATGKRYNITAYTLAGLGGRGRCSCGCCCSLNYPGDGDPNFPQGMNKTLTQNPKKHLPKHIFHKTPSQRKTGANEVYGGLVKSVCWKKIQPVEAINWARILSSEVRVRLTKSIWRQRGQDVSVEEQSDRFCDSNK